jgi:hypothetical protein
VSWRRTNASLDEHHGIVTENGTERFAENSIGRPGYVLSFREKRGRTHCGEPREQIVCIAISVRYACKSDRIDASQRTSALCNKPTHAAQQTARMGSGYSIACR